MLDLDRLKSLDSSPGSVVGDYCFLYGWVCLLRPERIAETGTSHGLSSIVMAQALQDMGVNGEIFTVDTNAEALIVARRQINAFGFSDRVKIACGDVSALAGGRYDLAFIDGDHTYDAARRDIEALHGRTSVLLLHDASLCPGVRRAADEFPGRRLLIASAVGEQWSGGCVVYQSAPGWYVLIP
jgi:predicted O-methyltransferase YrrM